MSSVAAALRRTGAVIRPALRGWRLSAFGGGLVMLVLAMLLLAHPGGMFRGGSSNGGHNPSLTAGKPNGTNGSTGSDVNGIGSGGPNANANGVGANGATPTPSAGVNGTGAKPGSSPKPQQTMPQPTDSLYGTADYLMSDCGAGYEPGETCQIYYHGIYNLVSHPTAKLDIEVIVDGAVLNTVTYVAPPGGHRFGGELKFTVPPHAKDIFYQSFLRDATGKTIIASPVQKTYGYG